MQPKIRRSETAWTGGPNSDTHGEKLNHGAKNDVRQINGRSCDSPSLSPEHFEMKADNSQKSSCVEPYGIACEGKCRITLAAWVGI
jgi:hypothetical protein